MGGVQGFTPYYPYGEIWTFAICARGWAKAANYDSLSCQPCAIGSYASDYAGGAMSCIACGDHFTTQQNGSLSVTDCMCEAGYDENWNQDLCTGITRV
jgi:hypothetical protein